MATNGTVSSKGQLVLPSALRRKKNLGAGAKVIFEETVEGILIKGAKPFAPTRLDEVFGMAGYHGPAKSVDDMQAAIDAEAARHR